MTEGLPVITILGTGYVGLTSAAFFAAAGFKTYVIDVNPTRLQAVKEGRSFFYEDGLDPLIAEGVKNGRLIPTSEYAEAVPESDVVFSCVGTPDNPDGSSNLTYVFAAAKEAAQHLKEGAVYVQKSTVPVGTGAEVKTLLDDQARNLHYASNPEFLREGTALHDSLWFDRIVVGGHDETAINTVTSIYKRVHEKRDEIAKIAGLPIPAHPPKGEYIITSLNSAELIKVSSNAFLALKISFANSIAKLADASNADVREVMDAVGADPRIGRAFLNAGRGYGGGCFPKDVSGLISSGVQHGVDMEIMQAVSAVNESMPGYIAEKLKRALGNNLRGRRITVLGLSFKAGTSDTRRSPGVALANIFSRAGAKTTVHDPEALEEAKEDLRRNIILAEDMENALSGSDAVLIATDWPVLLDYPLEDYAKHLSGAGILVDCMNRFDARAVQDAGLQYIGVGRG